ncbi:hypothetical protein DCAR_0206974 [Daucus carota subsp. sativus]|uniref:Ribosome-inactivating protein n=1 Tax=Daucus carota subsp. sativus TaxID=79200 RepID=A0AAF0WGJ2_DAUCS|nr:PREDICTED: abrin-b-like [Daucus carota subsp. sativus]WOG87743.1 hypothetical protein DCAR_0206974 [Daucus carota subsp. sativus]
MSSMVSRLLFLTVAVAWLTSSSIGSAGDNVLLMSTERIAEKLTFQPLYPSSSTDAIKTRYMRFIKYIREELVSGDEVHGIPRLQNPATLTGSNRFLQVALSNPSEDVVILAIDKATAGIVGYRTRSKACFFTDTNGPDTSSVFPGMMRYQLPFSSGYSGMEVIAGSRMNIYLGILELYECITHLDDLDDKSSLARCMLVTIQMVSEAIRYRYVENLVVEHITETNEAYLPTAAMFTFEENWKQLSTRIQQSVAGVISPAFELPAASNKYVTLTSITPTLGRNIALLLYVCDFCANILEPTVSIIGRNGLCVEVYSKLYYDTSPIIMGPCKSTDNSNQLWTLMQDGTIRSQGKCLTALGIGVAVIYNCTTELASSSIKWKIEENGNIISIDNNLALTAYWDVSRSQLRMKRISYWSKQAWSLSNSTEPVVTPIRGYKGMCLQASGNNTVQVSSCTDRIFEQYWALYPDGTVRPIMSKKNCLKSKASPDGEVVVVHDLCDGGKAERWLFNHDRSISDAVNKYVLEVENQKISVVKRSADAPTAQQIFDINFV